MIVKHVVAKVGRSMGVRGFEAQVAALVEEHGIPDICEYSSSYSSNAGISYSALLVWKDAVEAKHVRTSRPVRTSRAPR